MQTIYLSFVFVITNASEPDTTGCHSVPDRFIVLFRPQFKCRRVVNQNSRASFHGLDSMTEFSNPIFQPSFINPFFFFCPVFQLFLLLKYSAFPHLFHAQARLRINAMETRISQIFQHFLFVKIECHFYYLFLKKEECVFIAEKFTERCLFVHSSGFLVTLNLDK